MDIVFRFLGSLFNWWLFSSLIIFFLGFICGAISIPVPTKKACETYSHQISEVKPYKHIKGIHNDH